MSFVSIYSGCGVSLSCGWSVGASPGGGLCSLAKVGQWWSCGCLSVAKMNIVLLWTVFTVASSTLQLFVHSAPLFHTALFPCESTRSLGHTLQITVRYGTTTTTLSLCRCKKIDSFIFHLTATAYLVRAYLAGKPTAQTLLRRLRVQCEECCKPGHTMDICTCWTLHPDVRPTRARGGDKKRQQPTDSHN